MKEPLVKSVMTPFPYAVRLDAPIGEARRLMLEHRVRHLPVVSASRLVGIVTDRDIKLLIGPEMGSPDPKTLIVEDAYVDGCYTVTMNTPLSIVLGHMADRHIGATLVTNHGKLAGIFTSADACRTFADHLNRQFHPSNDPPEVA